MGSSRRRGVTPCLLHSPPNRRAGAVGAERPGQRWPQRQHRPASLLREGRIVCSGAGARFGGSQGWSRLAASRLVKPLCSALPSGTAGSWRGWRRAPQLPSGSSGHSGSICAALWAWRLTRTARAAEVYGWLQNFLPKSESGCGSVSWRGGRAEPPVPARPAAGGRRACCPRAGASSALTGCGREA